ncbi:MAG: hypothetical protein Q9165_000336 [Trypethelium subeluteriae]
MGGLAGGDGDAVGIPTRTVGRARRGGKETLRGERRRCDAHDLPTCQPTCDHARHEGLVRSGGPALKTVIDMSGALEMGKRLDIGDAGEGRTSQGRKMSSGGGRSEGEKGKLDMVPIEDERGGQGEGME